MKVLIKNQIWNYDALRHSSTRYTEKKSVNLYPNVKYRDNKIQLLLISQKSTRILSGYLRVKKTGTTSLVMYIVYASHCPK